MNLRTRLVVARKKAGLSQAELAKRLKVSAGTVAGWELENENGHGIRLWRLSKVARALGVTVAELLA